MGWEEPRDVPCHLESGDVGGGIFFLSELPMLKKYIAKMQVGVIFWIHDHSVASPLQMVLDDQPLLHTGTNRKRDFPCLRGIVREQLVKTSLGQVARP